MIPSGIRLYSWVDVEDVLVRAQEEGEWPDWLVWARAYWDGLTLGIKTGQTGKVFPWLAERFEPRFRNGDAAAVELESLPGRDKRLPIRIEEVDDDPVEPRFTPTLARPTVLRKPAEPAHPVPLAADLPPVVAFHSFKGGVGRTLHALALALTLTRHGKDTRVLLVDGDLEAPGLTWLFQERFPQLPVSLVDLLALVHGDPDPKAEDSLALVANRVQEIHLDGIFGLPAFRSLSQLSSIEVRPEHLIQGAEDPFLLTTLLARLGHLVGAQVVIVDLRAGFSELSTGLLLDPRVYRVLVTTLSSQSLEGTRQLLELLGDRSPSRNEEEPLPTVVLSQVPEDQLREEQGVLLRAERMLIEATRLFLPEAAEEAADAALDVVPITTPFDPRFLVLPGSWVEVLRLLDKSDIPGRLAPLAERLPIATSFLLEQRQATTGAELARRREALKDFAGKLVVAEAGNVQDFLPISPLRNLASDFATRPPVAVIVGSAGSGKTFTFLQAVRRGTWSRFVHDVGAPAPSYEAALCPVLSTRRLAEPARVAVESALQATARALGFSSPQAEDRTRDYLREGLRQDIFDMKWRERWLNVIAWRLGFAPGDESAGARLPDHLRHNRTSAVAIFDGLDDLFQAPATSASAQTALRALLQDVPAWIEQQPLRPLGIVVFVRRDLVQSALQKDADLFMARYEQYALRWGPDDALRLVRWTAAQAGALSPQVEAGDIHDLQPNALSGLWGRKVGHDRSRHARSTDWVLRALADPAGGISARDLVRFLYEAAKASLGDTFWQDRVLVPSALGSAVEPCSRAKIEEIGQENPAANEVFAKLRSLPEERRHIPFTREDVGLALEEIRLLADVDGILYLGEEYYMPEIFRLGLGFTTKRGARPRVLTLARIRK